MKVEVHILAYNEAEILPYTLRHYNTLAERIVVHDGGSDDGTRVLVKKWGAELHDWDTGGKLDDKLARELKNTCWHGTDADWVIVVDADEIVYFPHGLGTLHRYEDNQETVVKLTGWEMFSEVYPHRKGQIYEEVKMGAREERWYSKPVLFSPARVHEIEYTAGAHTCRFRLKTGQWMENPRRLTHPAAWLMHFHQIGPIERIAERYDATRARLSDVNVANRWGNFDPGMKHALDKRALIVPRLEKLFT